MIFIKYIEFTLSSFILLMCFLQMCWPWNSTQEQLMSELWLKKGIDVFEWNGLMKMKRINKNEMVPKSMIQMKNFN